MMCVNVSLLPTMHEIPHSSATYVHKVQLHFFLFICFHILCEVKHRLEETAPFRSVNFVVLSDFMGHNISIL